MRVVTLNIWGGRSIGQLENWLSETNADIYCFQEVFSSPVYGNFSLKDTDGHTVQTDLLTQLKDALPQYTCFFSPGSRGYVNDSTWVGFNIDYGIAIFVRSDWPVLGNVSGMVHGDFRYAKNGHPPLSRSAQVIRCMTPRGPVAVGNIHGLWDPTGKIDTIERTTQAKEFARLIKQVARPKDAVILCGDFNLMPNSTTFELMHKSHLKNLIVDYGITSTRTTHYKKSMRFADYMLVNDKVKVQQFKVPQEPILSDHCPLILDAQIKLTRVTKVKTALKLKHHTMVDI